MFKYITLFGLISFCFSAQAFQRLPNCYTLSKLWSTSYYYKLKPAWRKIDLACNKPEQQLALHEKIDIALARTAYVLDRTEFTSYAVASNPIVYYGRVQAVPRSMLNWVSARIDRLHVEGGKKAVAHADASGGVRRIFVTISDFNFQYGLPSGVGLSGQLVHEARHLGPNAHAHVQCRYGLPPVPPEFIGPITEDDTNCDETISEEFDLGGSHGVALLWLSWLALRSTWSDWDRNNCKYMVKTLLQSRINAPYEIKNAFSRRYLGENL